MKRFSDGVQLTSCFPNLGLIGKASRLDDKQQAAHPDQDNVPVAHTACENNPIGLGFAERWFLDATKLQRVAAPQIEAGSEPISMQGWLAAVNGQAHPSLHPAGVGIVGKAWKSRRELAGTYDDQWLAERHPGLPDDFQFRYWNGAHPQMQVPHLKGDETIVLTNLVPAGTPGSTVGERGNTILRIALPGHLPMGSVYTDQSLKFAPLLLDTLSVDLSEAAKPVVTLAWRATLMKSVRAQRFEARFVDRAGWSGLPRHRRVTRSIRRRCGMAEPLTVTITGDAGDVFREHFNIQSVEQARDAVKNLDSLWNTPNPWRDRPDLHDIFDEAGKSVQRRFETGVYKPQDQAQPSDHFSKGYRAQQLPPDTVQSLFVDIRGQVVSRGELQNVIQSISTRSNGIIQPSNITILR
ncbi:MULTISPECIES: DUF2169 domain-containing protein [Burkholderia]|uniref:DUF2169 domain-containing protein n=1 Tax=Burkholderia TaxID=32008 RepID=UPI001D105032|nr:MULTISPECIES: DUF2169 domain-containing protein [Burkholderia]